MPDYTTWRRDRVAAAPLSCCENAPRRKGIRVPQNGLYGREAEFDWTATFLRKPLQWGQFLQPGETEKQAVPLKRAFARFVRVFFRGRSNMAATRDVTDTVGCRLLAVGFSPGLHSFTAGLGLEPPHTRRYI